MTGWTGMQQACNTGNVSNTSASESCHTFKLCCTITHSSYTFIELHTGSEVLAKSLLGLVQNVMSYLVQSLMNKRCMGFGWLSNT